MRRRIEGAARLAECADRSLAKGEGRVAHATIRDVAREASVSVASVSRAMNGHPAVLPATRERVLSAARKLDYVPHAGARSLSMARAHTIGVVLPDLHGEFFSEIVRGMDREALRLGYQLLLSNMHADPAQAGQALRAMRGRVDGLLIMAPEINPALLADSMPRALPSVLMNTPEVPGYQSLQVENRAGAAAMVRHLRATGCRRIVHIAGPRTNKDAVERREGFLAAMAEAGATGDASVIEGDFSEQAGAMAAETIFSRLDTIDAVFAANDMMAIGCMLAFREAGIAVPDRISVAGFDDVPAARYLMPALTTMRIDIAELGARAVTRLIDTITNGASERRAEALVPELVIRSTTREGPGTTQDDRE